MRAEEREFFIKIRKAIVANPFGGERLAVDLELTGLSEKQPLSRILKELLVTVDDTISLVKKRVNGNLKNLSEKDQELLQFGMLFHAFHAYNDDFDELIRRQVKEGNVSCHVPFATDFLNALSGFGFNRSDSVRFLSIFFQMRRAFFFISRIAGSSKSVKELRKRLWNNIFTCDIEIYDQYLINRLEDFSTMLLGETGTGKGLAASAIGRSGFIPFDEKSGTFKESFAKTFISINLSQFPEQLIESELFGHRKGAFTGAIDGHKGVFSRCSPHGAIFIDEIGDVEVPVQIKLLKVLQERNFTPVGSRKTERFHGRVIAATNKSLDGMRKDGAFREDFYYRLCSDIIEMPPLRKRLTENPDELYIILEFIIAKILGQPSSDLTDKVGGFIRKNQPKHYRWPGNIRELEQCVRRYLITKSYQWQKGNDIENSTLGRQVDSGTLTAQELLSRYCRKLYKELGTYEAVSKAAELDRRTVKKYIQQRD